MQGELPPVIDLTRESSETQSLYGIGDTATDDFGYEAVIDRLHIHDWHATILHLLGLDHERLTFRHAGRDMRLTTSKGERMKGCSHEVVRHPD